MKKLITIAITFLSFSAVAQIDSIQRSYDLKRADTANYWTKDISYGNISSYQLLPRIDTVRCYTLFIMSEDGLLCDTKWYHIWAVRDKQTIIFYINQAKQRVYYKALQTILH